MNVDLFAERAKNAISVTTPPPDNYKVDVASYAKNMKHIDKSSEQGFVNENGSVIALKNDGSIRLASSEKAALHLTPDGQSTEIALESRTIANRKSFEVDDLVVNGHKLNPLLYEITDAKQVLRNESTVVADFTVMGTMLVKAWDQDLKRYVMIRRLVRTPMFSPALNVPEIPKSLGINDPTLRTKNLTVELPTATKAPAASTVPAASTTPATIATTPAAQTSQNLPEGTVWSSWETQPPQAPAGYMWHRQENGTLILKKEYGTP